MHQTDSKEFFYSAILMLKGRFWAKNGHRVVYSLFYLKLVKSLYFKYILCIKHKRYWQLKLSYLKMQLYRRKNKIYQEELVETTAESAKIHWIKILIYFFRFIDIFWMHLSLFYNVRRSSLGKNCKYEHSPYSYATTMAIIIAYYFPQLYRTCYVD